LIVEFELKVIGTRGKCVSENLRLVNHVFIGQFDFNRDSKLKLEARQRSEGA
jgi:hypothetical protein